VTPAFQPLRTSRSAAVLRKLCEQQVRVRLSAWLLHNFEHTEPSSTWRVSAWEIHPVTAIEVWEEVRRRHTFLLTTVNDVVYERPIQKGASASLLSYGVGGLG